MNGPVNFEYPWWLGYGHLVVTGLVASLFLFGYAEMDQSADAAFGWLLLWSISGFVAARFIIDINGRASLPTSNFLASGTGRVLDMGAGTGRSSIMVLEARPRATLVALDLFSDSYQEHFGAGASPQDRLLANLKAAGVEQRVNIELLTCANFRFSRRNLMPSSVAMRSTT
ncbi:MAG: hypothetical protein WKF37_18965 [Bryobacteraceae bacterium]